MNINDITEERIKDAFDRYDIFTCATARADLEEMFRILPSEHPLRKQFKGRLDEYKILGEKDGN